MTKKIHTINLRPPTTKEVRLTFFNFRRDAGIFVQGALVL